MAGVRLSLRDRHVIASGLAAGHGYAEIARRLGRPTSTVSREVSRNGGRAGYQADQAQHSAMVRAGRRRPGPPAGSPDESATGGNDLDALRAVARRFTTLLVQAGFPRVVAGVLAHLVTSDTTGLTADVLGRRLRVSPASISKAVRELERQQLLHRERLPHCRRERYLLAPDAHHRIWTARTRIAAMWVEAATEARARLGAATPAGARMAELEQFLRLVHDDMVRMMVRTAERWRATPSRE
ncbi:helix-turn-helix domain-containing protein [Streptoalloteichus hindustanus]|uniref:MarR family protein n=1 Tax=Streptoalloteichus hindustanus TaxID=2017 RepID=A0A1M5DNE2_STRHI|nr:helix-turn-helix domain-containing protein [Streptoalloteichus hindustanus]SHF68391.1 MarR family protein [Streptoalloteichus hindustanus]